MSAGPRPSARTPPPVPVETTLIAGYLAHLGPAETRLVVEQVALDGEALLRRIHAAAADGADADRVRRLAHDLAGTIGSLGFAVHAAMARAIETAVPDPDPATLARWLLPLGALRGRIAASALAALDELVARREKVP